jgi:chaperone modulatory protein CbpM
MSKKEIVIIADYSENTWHSVDQLREMFNISESLMRELIAHDIILPVGVQSAEWSFDMVQLKRLQTALRLQHDLEVNLAGVALVLELMDELETLRSRTTFLEKHILK